MEYQIIFDALQKPFNWQFSISGLFFAGVLCFVVAVLISASKGSFIKRISNRMVMSSVLGIIFCLGWVYVTWSISYTQYEVCQKALQSGDFSSVEGEIVNFQPSSNVKGRPPEQFTVNGVTFRYKDSMVSCGYTQTTDGNGPLQNGANVRIAYLPQINNTILRLEVQVSK